jgi:hypothetical protein
MTANITDSIAVVVTVIVPIYTNHGRVVNTSQTLLFFCRYLKTAGDIVTLHCYTSCDILTLLAT